MSYLNGQVPYDVVSVVLATGYDSNGYWEFRCTPSFAARWFYAKKEAERRFGRTIYIRPGWNIYRPLFSQKIARTNACKQGNCNGAAVEGTSSHGGEWRGRPCLAADVDPNGLTWDQVDEAMEAAGFSARLITEAMSGIKGGERWHYIDFNAFGPVPAWLGATPFATVDAALLRRQKEDTMYVRGASDASSVYAVTTDPTGALAVRLCGPNEAAYAKAGGLVIFGDDATLTGLGVEAGYVIANRASPVAERVNALVWGRQIDRGSEGRVSVLQDLADTGTLARKIAGRPDATATVDETELATALAPQLAPLIGDHLNGVSDDDLDRIARASADEIDRRARERLNG